MCLHPYTYILHQYRALYLLFILLSVIYYYISIVLYKGNKKNLHSQKCLIRKSGTDEQLVRKGGLGGTAPRSQLPRPSYSQEHCNVVGGYSQPMWLLGLVIWFCMPNWPALCVSSSSPPRPATGPSPASYNPLLPLAGNLPQVLLILCNFQFCLPHRSPGVSQAPGPPGSQLAPSPSSHDPLLLLSWGIPQVPLVLHPYSVNIYSIIINSITLYLHRMYTFCINTEPPTCFYLFIFIVCIVLVGCD